MQVDVSCQALPRFHEPTSPWTLETKTLDWQFPSGQSTNVNKQELWKTQWWGAPSIWIQTTTNIPPPRPQSTQTLSSMNFSHHTSGPNLHTMEPLHHLHWSKMLTPWTVHDAICNLCCRTLLRRPPLAAIAQDSTVHLKTLTAQSLHILDQSNGIRPGGITRQKAHVAHHHKEGLSATQGNVCALVVVQETQRKTQVVLNFWLVGKDKEQQVRNLITLSYRDTSSNKSISKPWMQRIDKLQQSS